MENNAAIIFYYMTGRGWTAQAVAALLGNMEAESTISPGRYEVGGIGFGLVQWTPPEKLWSWIRSTYGNENYTNGYYQLSRILWELENGEQYYATPSYPLSFREFSVSTQTPAYLAGAWLLNYERPGDTSESAQRYRGELADRWYSFITQLPPETVPVPPLWLLFKFRR